MYRFLIALVFLCSQARAAEADRMISIQQAEISQLKKQLAACNEQITSLNTTVTTLNTTLTSLSQTVTNLSNTQTNTTNKLNKYVSDAGGWAGADPNNVVNRVIQESITCAQFCQRDYGSGCFWTTFANWKDGSNALCDDNRQPLKRCLCVR